MGIIQIIMFRFTGIMASPQPISQVASQLADDKINTNSHIDTIDTGTPSLASLYEQITPFYASDWKVLGTLLGLPSEDLKTIELGYPTNPKWCCNEMLQKWLEIDTEASWDKINKAIKSPAVQGGYQLTGEY